MLDYLVMRIVTGALSYSYVTEKLPQYKGELDLRLKGENYEQS